MPIQLHQVFNLLFIISLSYYLGYLYLSITSIFFIIIFTFALDHLLFYIKYQKRSSRFYSSLITSFGIILMMVSSEIYIYYVVIFLGLLQKYYLTYKEDFEEVHFFNPSNIALILGLLLFYDKTHIVIGQLGETLWLKIIIIVMATIILLRAKRVIIPIGFVIFYMISQNVFVIGYDPMLTMEEVYKRFYSVSFIVFILYMLTDPKTTPNRYVTQLIFALLLAVLSSLLDRYYSFRVQHLFLTLFLLSLFVPMINYYPNSKKRNKLLSITAILFFLALSVIITVESQAPYYFEMDG
ncbi:MAG: Unknown protein [uncultured Sulfurovum sp.]|uniref:Uncharacterized protein n=1 Tax=uncultured Sulfurovum sp. TaxID=269237 RepID=A0A6S6TSC4_9BACT|nr:MAG: Unknown protein [uncultured Sulfurovum sp.]